MKNAFRQGKRDALASNPRFKPAYWLDRYQYNAGYDEGLAQLRKEQEMEQKKSKEDISGKVYKHIKSGGLYRLVCLAVHEGTGAHYAVYESLKTGEVWLRPSEEFFDGRFEEVMMP